LILLIGASGSGKSHGALALACGIGKNVIAIDTENKRLDLFKDDFKFKKIDLKAPYSSARYIAAVDAAVEAGADCLVIDQISFEWAGTGGVLQQVDDNPANNQMARWKEPSRNHSDFIDYIASLKLPTICCCRAKEQYEISKDSATGKTSVKKLGVGPIQRGRNAGEGIEYEFITSFLLDEDHLAKPMLDRTKLFGKLTTDEEGNLITVGEPILLTVEVGRKIASWWKGGSVPRKK
jgi:hypothetical protein